MKFLQMLMVAGLIMLTAGLSAAAAPAGSRADGLYARMTTSKGDIFLRLYFKKTPLTVANFVGLAQGSKDSDRGKGVPFYNGLIFHRVIAGFMIQGGDPQGNGRGGPGYKFPDEFNSSLRFDGPGVLAMANAGPDTNGSQFFITRAATPWLNGKHTIFGRVVEGQDVVNAIRQGDKIKQIKIVRRGAAARAFKCDQQAFDKLLARADNKILKAKEKKAQAVARIIARKWPGAVTTPSGLKYVVIKKGHGDTPKPGTMLTVNYTGRLLDGTKFDSSVDRGRPFRFPVGMHRVIKGWDEAFSGMRKGEKRILIIPPQLAYGSRGAGRVIPPDATLVFDVELINF
ncbi:peptidylprolyl isomerase [Desulfobacterota bacterium M19]